jgi:hypothetical protein
LKFSGVWFTTRQASMPTYSVDNIATVEFNVCGLHHKWKQLMAYCICHSSTKTKLIIQFCTCVKKLLINFCYFSAFLLYTEVTTIIWSLYCNLICLVTVLSKTGYTMYFYYMFQQREPVSILILLGMRWLVPPNDRAAFGFIKFNILASLFTGSISFLSIKLIRSIKMWGNQQYSLDRETFLWYVLCSQWSQIRCFLTASFKLWSRICH